MNEYPPVSCMCLTYGRTHVLEEALNSFLLQDYPGEKELIILNDLKSQNIIYDHPEVRIINTGKRFNTVGEKRNACAALTSNDFLFVWDDDDIFLPNRLKFSIEKFNIERRFFKPTLGLVINNGIMKGPERNLFHSSSCWHRSLFNEVRGYAHMGSGQDQEIELAFEKVIGKNRNYDIDIKDIFYIYRWSGTNSYHLSGFGKDRENEKTGNIKVEEYINRKMKQKEIPSGDIYLDPKWQHDYIQITKNYIESKNPNKD